MLRKRVEARLLLVTEHVVELLERWPHHLHSIEHRLHALLHRIDAADRRQRHIGGARGLDDLSRLHRCIAKLVEGHALFVSRIDRLCNFVDRDAGDVARVITAILAVAPHGGLGGAAHGAGGCSWRVPT